MSNDATSTGSGDSRLFDPIDDALERVRERFVDLDDGELADYIPELSEADRSLFGLALVSLDGNVYRAGDADQRFTMQSISKPFVYALAVSDLGLDAVTERVGVEPSGEAFNAISLDPDSGRPDNPMINAGAILTGSLVAGDGPQERLERIVRTLSGFAGRALECDQRVLDSERETGDRNRALSYLMRNAGALRVEVDDALEVYVGQCSLLVTAVDIATMAATLANAGLNPVTGESVVEPEVAEHVMSIMATCGMYDASGDWLLRVGLPAKSGVGGGVVAVSPGQFGIGSFSPPLDERGNSVRSTHALRALSEEFSLHLLHQTRGAAQGVRIEPVQRREAQPEHHELDVIVMRGDIEFMNAERAAKALQQRWQHWDESSSSYHLVLDLTDVTGVTPVAAAVIDALIRTLGEQGVVVLSVDPAGRGLFAAVDDEYADLDGARAHLGG